MTAPSARSRRRASSTILWSRSPGSRIAVIRVAISRSARSASARRSMTARERASSSIRRALRIAIEAWVARAVRTSPSASSKAAGWRETTDSVPSGAPSPVNGTAITDRIPDSRTNSRAGSSRRNRSSTR